jgi:hypothetical protein
MCKVGASGPLLMWVKGNNQEVLKVALTRIATRQDENQFATMDLGEVTMCKILETTWEQL